MEPGARRDRGDARPKTRPLLIAYIAVLIGLAAGVGWVGDYLDIRPPGETSWAALPMIALLLVAAEYYYVRFRFGGEINALNLIDALLAPLLFAFDAPVAMGVVAVTQVAGSLLRRNATIKMAFNVGQWTLATGVGALTLGSISGDGISWGTVLGLVAALAVIGIINQTAFTLVMAIVNRRSVGRLVAALRPIMPGWLAGWILNAFTGVLLVFAYVAHPAGVMLFPMPLAVLYLAYRGYAAARSDQVRLSGVPRAVQTLAAPLDPSDAIEAYLAEVVSCFEARAAALVLRTASGRDIARWSRTENGVAFERFEEPFGVPSLEGALLEQPHATRITAAGEGALSAELLARGWRDCLTAPLLEQGSIAGALMVFDQAGLEGLEAGELAVLESLARETQATLTKGRLVSVMAAEQRRLDQIVSSTSDGILTIDTAGVVRSWNPALERITGLAAADVVGRADPFETLQPSTEDGHPVRVDRWNEGAPLPALLRIVDAKGHERLLACSYSRARDGAGTPTALVVVARDMTPERETAELRRRFDRLAEAEAAQHQVVHHLQEALMPGPPRAQGVEFGMRYLSSDPRAPTGGDLYDWQVLPGGDVHAAVVDVLGHGVAATKDALNVVHALRTLAMQGCALEDVVARADELLGAQNPDLVATVMIARLDPRTGRLRLASGGHPPALVVGPARGVQIVPAPGGAIGWPGAGTVEVAEVILEPGDAVVMYTDGLVESGKDIIAGEEALQRHARALVDASAAELAAGLLQGALSETGADRRDDSLVLVLRRAERVRRATWRLHPSPERAADARRDAMTWFADHHLASADLDDLKVVCGELLANACAAARSTIHLRVAVEDDLAWVEVEDDGIGDADLATYGLTVPSQVEEAGRGLFIVRNLSDDVSVLSTGDGTVVRAMKRLRPERPRGAAAQVTSDRYSGST